MFIDTHMHEKTWSQDSFLGLAEMIEIGRERGLDAICITDHDSMGLKDFAKEYSAKQGFPVFVGIEYFSLDGDIVTFGIDDYPEERIPAQEYIDRYVKPQGGVCFSAHPYRMNNRGLGTLLHTIQGMDGIEVLNGSTPPDKNQLAADDATAYGYAMLGSSDCHIPEKLGVYATYFMDEIRSESDLIQAIRAGRCLPAYHDGREYHIWDPRVRDFYEAGVTPQDLVERRPTEMISLKRSR